MKKHYFISGLPRSGSTLLCNILAQNPKFYVPNTISGCHDVLFNIRNQWGKSIEHQAEGINYGQLHRVLSACLDSYHNTNKDIIIDKGRGWLFLIEMIEFIKAEPVKIIVPVRDISEILASFENLWRKSKGITQFEQSDFFKSQTVDGRCDIWTGASQPVGLAYNRVKDAISRGKSDSMLFVEFDDLTSNPADALRKIYEFLEEEIFMHNFENIEDTNTHKIPELHTIRPKVEPIPHRAIEILGKDLCAKYSNLEVWRS